MMNANGRAGLTIFRIAAGLKEGKPSNRISCDADVYKWIEAVAYDVATAPPSEVKAKADNVIDLIEQAQEESGYLLTWNIINKKAERWKDLAYAHELYCGGHLIQAALAYDRATGEKKLLDVAVKWADYIDSYFGPKNRSGTSGHPEVEMALVELYRETGETKYLTLAEFFIDERGKGFVTGSRGAIQKQDHLPVRKQVTVEGHTVCQLYLLCGISDIYSETGDHSLLTTLEKQWDNFTRKKMAITGGGGAHHDKGEMFGLDYEIPNRTGYYETCTAIASFMWNWRMLQITGEANYADIKGMLTCAATSSHYTPGGNRYLQAKRSCLPSPISHGQTANLERCGYGCRLVKRLTL